MDRIAAFYAFPSDPQHVAKTIDNATVIARDRLGATLETWRETDVAGRFIADQILSRIASADVLIADITQLNFNVAYEIGFGLAKGKRVVLTRHRGVTASAPLLQDVGIFDTIGYEEYENAEGLAATIANINDVNATARNIYPLNQAAPVYLLDARFRTDPVTRIVSRVKKARLFFRSFDPSESPRLSVTEAVEQVAQSYGVLLHLIPERIMDARVHNLRAAFLGGLAEGFEKVLLLLQDGEEPVPLDYRNIVKVFLHPSHIDDAVEAFASDVYGALQQATAYEVEEQHTLLERLTFGASSAENEFRDLAGYYLETDQFQRALRGEVRLVVGRKGSGKTAIFAQVRDRVRENRSNVVLDLRPDGYQLLKFKEMVLSYLGEGALEHTITAFWEYLLLLEICHKLLEKDRVPHTRDRRLYEPYRALSELYDTDRYVSEGDFSERLSRLLQSITDEYQQRFGRTSQQSLSAAQVTELLYRHDVTTLTANVVDYLKLKEELWLLFDNIDKGWPSHGLERPDLAIVRALLEATRKVERHLQRRDVPCHTLVFLRNDVYELLISQTPDRGKEGRVALDWSDPDLLREVIRKRLVFSGMSDRSFSELWPNVAVSHVAGEETSQFLIDRCLMRPRALIDLANHCRGFAVNLRHQKIEADDIRKGLQAYSSDLVIDIGYEIRDIFPAAENVLYAFIDEPQAIGSEQLTDLLYAAGIGSDDIPAVVELLLWYAFLGVRRPDGTVIYIYDVNYEMPILRGILKKSAVVGVSYHINPAFVPGLQVRSAQD